MRKKRFTVEQGIGVLTQAQVGVLPCGRRHPLQHRAFSLHQVASERLVTFFIVRSGYRSGEHFA
jgi:hypothetical protein